MTASELARHAVDDTGYQLQQCLQGLSEEQWDAKLNDRSLSPRELVGHLCGCYAAYRASVTGDTYEWGSYAVQSTRAEDLLKELGTCRDQAVQALGSAGTDKALKEAMGYISLHDAYHVGQLCSLRLSLDPNWDAYSIYQG